MKHSIPIRILSVGLVGCLLGILLCTIYKTRPPAPALQIPDSISGEWIVFACGSIGGRHNGIYRIHPDGAVLTRLTNNDEIYGSPTWSPDGEWIVYDYGSHYRQQDTRIGRMRFDGSDATDLISSGKSPTVPKWSPNGNLIAFISDPSDRGIADIYTMDTNGNQISRLTYSGDINSLTWSPDSAWIAFVRGTSRLYKMRADGRDMRIVFSSQYGLTGPAWSPDGEWIALSSSDEDRMGSNIGLLRADGSEYKSLTNEPGANITPSWSPDGDWLVFSSNLLYGFPFQIYVIRRDGSQMRRLTSLGCEAVSPDWFSYGNRILRRT